MKYTIDFVLTFCDLMPKNADTQEFLNTSHLRKILNVKAETVGSNSKILEGYFIDDEMIDPPSEDEPD